MFSLLSIFISVLFVVLLHNMMRPDITGNHKMFNIFARIILAIGIICAIFLVRLNLQIELVKQTDFDLLLEGLIITFWSLIVIWDLFTSKTKK